MRATRLDTFVGNDRFLVIRRLGAGGMGVVYEAFDRERNQRLALKTILHPEARTLYRFKQEFRALADLAHPNLVRLYELFSEGDFWFFTMELVDGINFLDFVCPEQELPEDDPVGLTDSFDLSFPRAIKPPTTDPIRPAAVPAINDTTTEHAPRGSEGPESRSTLVDATDDHVPRRVEPAPGSTFADPASRETTEFQPSSLTNLPQAKPLPGLVERRPPHYVRLRAALRQVAEVLAKLHEEGKLHRDLKPSNVLVTRQGRVVLLDFGLSTELETQTDPQTTEGNIVGTVSYMAPEQAAGLPLTPASDWYSVGVMLFRALTGQLPFSGKPLDVLMEKQRRDAQRPSELVAGLPPDLDSLCHDLLRRQADDRPTSEAILSRLGVEPASLVRPGAGRGRLFVGRETHLARLRDAFTRVAGGQTVTSLVHGISGVGKSALVQQFLDSLVENNEAVVLAGRCYEQESVAYKALDSLIDALSRYLRRLNRGEADALMPRDVHALARVFPILSRVAAVAEAPQRVHEIVDQQELRRKAFAALRELLSRIGDRRPLVLTVDDIQWGDIDSANLLTDLLQPPDPPVVFLILSYRREYAAASPCLRILLENCSPEKSSFNVVEVGVEPMTTRESVELALALIGQSDQAARTVAEMIAREAGGSPFFVDELVQYLKAEGEISESLVTSSSLSLDEVLWRRIRALPKASRELLEVLAVASQPIRQALACRAAGQGPDGFTGLASLRSSHLVRGTGPGALDDVETYHDRIRETVLHHLEPDRRKIWHRNLAHELEAAGNTDPETLGVHFEAAGEPLRAAGHYGKAADEASRALAFERAVKLYEHAIQLRPIDDSNTRLLRTHLGDALANAGRSVEAARAYLTAVDEDDRELAIELRRRSAYQFLISGHIDEGLAVFATILDQVGMPLPSTPQRALMRLLVSRAKLRLRGLRFQERPESDIPTTDLETIDISRSVAVGISVVDVIRGSDYQTRSLLLALRSGEPFRICLSLGWEAVHSSCSGRFTSRRTAQLIRSAESLAQRLGHPHALGMASMSRGAAAYLEGRFAEGLEHLDRAEGMLRDQCTGVVWELDTTRIFSLWALFYLGRLAELEARCDRLFKEARERGDRYLEATPGPYVGSVTRLAHDDVPGARRIADEMLGKWSQHGFHIQHLCHYYGSLYVDLYEGDAQGAWRRITQTESLLKNSLLMRIVHVTNDVSQHRGRCALAAAATCDGSRRQALRREAERAAGRLARAKLPWADALRRMILGGLAAQQGRPDQAVKHLTRAVELADSAQVLLFASAARYQLGRLIGGDEGRAKVQEAHEALSAQGIQDPERMAHAFLPGFR